MPTLTLQDVTLTGQPLGAAVELSLVGLAEQISVRDLIRERVYQEVDDHNRRVRESGQACQPFRGLVAPTVAERQLNGPHVGAAGVMTKEVDWRRQFDAACAAFERNGFLVLVDERQVDGLDEPLRLTPSTRVTFVKLTALVGG